MDLAKTDIRVLSSMDLEQYRYHLRRLVSQSQSDRPAGLVDNNSVDSYCLRLMSECVVIVGAYVDEAMRGAVQIWFDHTRLRADAFVSIEQEFQNRDFDRMLLTSAIDLSRSHGMAELRLDVQTNNTEMAQLVVERGGVLMISDSKLRFHIPLSGRPTVIDETAADVGAIAS
jgi:ribosomal protein S18 acetylase RimI-like enzyme